MQTQEKPVDQKIDPKKKYQLSANPCDGRGAFGCMYPQKVIQLGFSFLLKQISSQPFYLCSRSHRLQ